MNKLISIPDEIITIKIYLIRSQKVMLDRDLAKLYGVATKQLKDRYVEILTVSQKILLVKLFFKKFH